MPNIDELWEKYAHVYCTEAKDVTMDKYGFIQAIAEIISIPLDAEVGMPKPNPNPQLFTIDKIRKLLKQQRGICLNHSLIKYITKAGIIRGKEYPINGSVILTVDDASILDAPEPKIVKST